MSNGLPKALVWGLTVSLIIEARIAAGQTGNDVGAVEARVGVGCATPLPRACLSSGSGISVAGVVAGASGSGFQHQGHTHDVSGKTT